jgi:hypothetical protein
MMRHNDWYSHCYVTSLRFHQEHLEDVLIPLSFPLGLLLAIFYWMVNQLLQSPQRAAPTHDIIMILILLFGNMMNKTEEKKRGNNDEAARRVCYSITIVTILLFSLMIG